MNVYLMLPPRLDREIFGLALGYNRLNEDEEERAIEEQNYLKEKWSLSRNKEWKRVRKQLMTWGSDDIYWNGSKLRLCLHCQNMRHLDSHCLESHMSSQLLLYRLIIFTGYPPSSDTDMDKCCWEMELLHSDKFTILRFWDSKGGARVGFRGAEDAEKDALKLINFLASPNFLILMMVLLPVPGLDQLKPIFKSIRI